MDKNMLWSSLSFKDRVWHWKELCPPCTLLFFNNWTGETIKPNSRASDFFSMGSTSWKGIPSSCIMWFHSWFFFFLCSWFFFFLLYAIWQVGDCLMVYLLKHASIFLPLSHNTFHQVAGSPVKLQKHMPKAQFQNPSIIQSGNRSQINAIVRSFCYHGLTACIRKWW